MTQQDDTERDGRGRFRAGNTTGRRGGSPTVRRLHELQAAIQSAFTTEQIVEVLKQLRTQAIDGDEAAARVFLGRVLGREREEEGPVPCELPPLRTAQECADAVGAVLGDLAAGRIDRSATRLLLDAIEQSRRVIETRDLAERVAQLESQQGHS